MKNRILRNWTAIRVIHVIVGIAITAQAITVREWLGILPGVYFFAMGVFSIGCASGRCSYIPRHDPKVSTGKPQ